MRRSANAIRVPWLAGAGLLAAAGAVAAQPAGGNGGASRPLAWGAHAVAVATHAVPALAGEALTEAVLTQPVLSAAVRGWGGRLQLQGMLNLEGVTLADGELNPGAWGEGFVDRRHPHTLLHEAVGTVELRRGRAAASLTIGKGFAPYGTDDPMARPFIKFPVNHHLAQILERAVVIGAVRYGPAALEAGVFNGDEPQDPQDMPTLDRLGDSWAARATVWPGAGLELSASHAWLKSPEHVGGAGLDRRMWSAAVRLERSAGAWRLYGLAEWARADELHLGERRFGFESVLLEGSAAKGGLSAALRLERTTRPEEERLEDPFRTPRPHADFNILGRTRWTIATLRVQAEPGRMAQPFVEAAYLHPVQAARPSLFVPAEFYGGAHLWSVSAGVRLAVGSGHGRMGRYGAAVAAGAGLQDHAAH